MSVLLNNNNNIIVTDDGRRYQKPDFSNRAEAYFLGGAASRIVQKSCMKLFSKPFDKNGELQLSSKNIQNAVYSILEKTGLDKKGVSIRNIANNKDSISSAAQEILEILPECTKRLMKVSPSHNNKISRHILNSAISYAEGRNAIFGNNNKIYVNMEKSPYMAFHEIGHGIIKTNKLGKYLHSASKPWIGFGLTALITPIVLFKRKKADGEQPKNKLDKALTFVRDNAAKITLAGFLPMLLDEGGASIIGGKLAKPFLTKADYKALNKFNGKAFLTYAGQAIGVAAGIYAAKKVCDFFTKPKEIKS